MVQAARPTFRPTSWSKARREVADETLRKDIIYINESKMDKDTFKKEINKIKIHKDKPYYSREYKELQQNKQKWMGVPFIASRKKARDKVPRSKRAGKVATQQYINNSNRYNTFDLAKEHKRAQILTNFKQITRIINKNFIKKKEQFHHPLHQSESEFDHEERERKEQEEQQNINKMQSILRELSVKEVAPKVKAYPTFKYTKTDHSRSAHSESVY